MLTSKFKNHKCLLMVVEEVKHHQRNKDSSCGHHGYLYQISQQSIQHLPSQEPQLVWLKPKHLLAILSHVVFPCVLERNKPRDSKWAVSILQTLCLSMPLTVASYTYRCWDQLRVDSCRCVCGVIQTSNWQLGSSRCSTNCAAVTGSGLAAPMQHTRLT